MGQNNKQLQKTQLKCHLYVVVDCKSVIVQITRQLSVALRTGYLSLTLISSIANFYLFIGSDHNKDRVLLSASSK
jgi:hypothetical protein